MLISDLTIPRESYAKWQMSFTSKCHSSAVQKYTTLSFLAYQSTHYHAPTFRMIWRVISERGSAVHRQTQTAGQLTGCADGYHPMPCVSLTKVIGATQPATALLQPGAGSIFVEIAPCSNNSRFTAAAWIYTLSSSATHQCNPITNPRQTALTWAPLQLYCPSLPPPALFWPVLALPP